MVHLYALMSAVVVTLTACRPSNAETEQLVAGEERAITAGVDSAMRGYLRALAARDANQVIRYFADDSAFRVYFDAAPMDYQRMSGTVRAFLGGLREVRIEPVTVSVTVLGRNAAIADFAFRETFTDTSGQVRAVRGSASWTWQRHAGDWKIVHGDAVHLPDTSAAGH